MQAARLDQRDTRATTSDPSAGLGLTTDDRTPVKGALVTDYMEEDKVYAAGAFEARRPTLVSPEGFEGVDQGDLYIMLLLRGRPQTPTALAKLRRCTRSNISLKLRHLEKAGYVEAATVLGNDLRARPRRLTASGRAVVRRWARALTDGRLEQQ